MSQDGRRRRAEPTLGQVKGNMETTRGESLTEPQFHLWHTSVDVAISELIQRKWIKLRCGEPSATSNLFGKRTPKSLIGGLFWD